MKELSEKLEGIAKAYLATLIRARFENRITWQKPKKAKDIAANWNAARERAKLPALNLEDSDIRELTNYWRRRRWPIGTNGAGYWFAFKPEELEPAIAHMQSRVTLMSQALVQMKQANFTQMTLPVGDVGKNDEVLERAISALIAEHNCQAYQDVVQNS